MNPPSDVTVLSDIDPFPSLLPLLLDALDELSSPFLDGRGITKDIGWSALRDGGVTGEFELESDARRRPELWLRLSAIMAEIDTEVVAGETVGRRMLVIRRGVTWLSRSICLRLGEERDDWVLSERSAAGRRWLRC